MGWLMGWLMGSTSSWVDGRGRVVGSVVVSSSNMSMAASRSGSTASSCGAGCCVGGCGAAGTWAGCCGLCLLVGGDRSKSRSRRSGSKSRRVSISSWSCCCWSCCCCCCWCCSSRGRVRGRVSGWRSLGSQLSWKSAMGGAGWCWVVLGVARVCWWWVLRRMGCEVCGCVDGGEISCVIFRLHSHWLLHLGLTWCSQSDGVLGGVLCGCVCVC